MRYETYKGKQFIILDENEKIYISSGAESLDNSINIENTEKGLNITGDSSMINSISGKDMIEKVYIPPVISKDEIIEKCDRWLEMYKKVHDYFKKIVLKKKSAEENISMRVQFTKWMKYSGETGKSISINLDWLGAVIKEGVRIDVALENDIVFKYILANVVDYYISKNCTNIEHTNWDGILHSKESDRIIADLHSFRRDNDDLSYYDIIRSIIINHNLGESSQQIIDNGRYKIFDQQMGSDIDSSIEYSLRQYKCLFPDEKCPTLRKTKKRI